VTLSSTVAADTSIGSGTLPPNAATLPVYFAAAMMSAFVYASRHCDGIKGCATSIVTVGATLGERMTGAGAYVFERGIAVRYAFCTWFQRASAY